MEMHPLFPFKKVYKVDALLSAYDTYLRSTEAAVRALEAPDPGTALVEAYAHAQWVYDRRVEEINKEYSAETE